MVGLKRFVVGRGIEDPVFRLRKWLGFVIRNQGYVRLRGAAKTCETSKPVLFEAFIFNTD
jgi:hypothetical protein